LIRENVRNGDVLMTDVGNPPNTGEGPSRMAEGIALQRFAESNLPEDERIFCDPYAVRFLDPAMLAWAKDHPAEAKALAEEWEQKMPGWGNSIRARVRYFDDSVKWEAGAGLEQLVILGAGYDTRAYRLEGLRNLKVFEVDRPETLAVKRRILGEIFTTRPDHVVYVPARLGADSLGAELSRAGYSKDKKTLFLLEGLVMYMPRDAVAGLLAFIRANSLPGSSVLFDCVPDFMISGTVDREGSGNIRNYTRAVGEPLRFGLPEGEAAAFLAGLGFDDVHVVTAKDFRRLYFTGKNAARPVSGLLSLVSGIVPGPALSGRLGVLP
jgi:methyltransferase (TIGR00027 family)